MKIVRVGLNGCAARGMQPYREAARVVGGKRPGPVTPMLEAARSTKAGFEEDVARRARDRDREERRVRHTPREEHKASTKDVGRY